LRAELASARNPAQLALLHPLGWRCFPPFAGIGARVLSIDCERGLAHARLPLRWRNMNMAGSHFGGALYTLVDPFHVFLLSHQLGAHYLVWDVSSAITFVRPARDRVDLLVEIPPELVAEIRARVDRHGSTTEVFTSELRDPSGAVIAKVEKVVRIVRAAGRPPRPTASSARSEAQLRAVLEPVLSSPPCDRSLEVVVLTRHGTLAFHAAVVGRRWRLCRGASVAPAVRLTFDEHTLAALEKRRTTWLRAMLRRSVRVSGRFDWTAWLVRLLAGHPRFEEVGAR
jgi:acyl-coenzyme A thioesterase PaaI-like protein